MKIIQCNTCGKIFKIPKIKDNIFYTDLNGRFIFEKANARCLVCNKVSTFSEIETDDWIADKIFTVGSS